MEKYRRARVAAGVARLGLAAWLSVAAAFAASAQSVDEPAPNVERLNGFSLSGATVPEEEIVAGGPPRDGIRSVDAPTFTSVEESDTVEAGTPVLGISIGDEARAYPVHLLEPHQVVNDVVGGVPVVVTYDPLTGTPRVFRAAVAGRNLHFGVSGLIHAGSFLLYDRETESLWSQFLGVAIAGPLAGTRLERVTVRQEPMAIWLGRNAETTALERPEPTRIDYRHSAFSSYWVSEQIAFPVKASDPRYHPKEVVVGVVSDGVERAYLGSVLTGSGGRIVDEVGGKKIRIAYDSETSTFVWDVPEGVDVTEAYWFAWKGFHPNTEVWNDHASGEAAEDAAGDAP